MSRAILILKGIIIGIAGIIPGVSASVFAVTTGVYEQTLEAITALKKSTRKSIGFLTPLALGALIGVILSAGAVLKVCEHFPLFCYSFFVGVMAVGLVDTLKKSGIFRENALKSIGLMLFCCVAVVLPCLLFTGDISSLPQTVTVKDIFPLFLAGALSFGAVCLPGMSGSVTLMLLGLYEEIYYLASSPLKLISSILSGSADISHFYSTLLLIPFLLGGIFGTVLVAKSIKELIRYHCQKVYTASSGLIFGSIITVCAKGIAPALSSKEFHPTAAALFIFMFILSGALLTRCFSPTEKEVKNAIPRPSHSYNLFHRYSRNKNNG